MKKLIIAITLLVLSTAAFAYCKSIWVCDMYGNCGYVTVCS